MCDLTAFLNWVTMKVRFKEKSLIARIGATLLREKCIAVTIGNTIHLWNASMEDIIKNKKWLQHEFVHIQQFKQYGFVKFLLLYLWESLKNGYYNNKFEIEA